MGKRKYNKKDILLLLEKHSKIIIAVFIGMLVVVVFAKMLSNARKKGVSPQVLKQTQKNTNRNVILPPAKLSKKMLKNIKGKSYLNCGKVVKTGFDIARLGDELVKFSDVYMYPSACKTCVTRAFLADGTSLMIQFSQPYKGVSKTNWWNICGKLTDRHSNAAWISASNIEPR